MKVDSQDEDINNLRNEILDYPILKKIPLVMTYVLEQTIQKCTPVILKGKSLAVNKTVSIGAKVFFTFVFPVVYIYQRDKDDVYDSIMQYEE